ncbi:hypothetical protein IQ266_07755 [filamentous cyanobacterium LEGE 11480]|uniref:Uncharacterized protein n=1 Tax=Romeriopsis navalis LEGE 11480 TaxID=2777977 RepID=A0A928VL36_9CYAN|nr:hypothetical protein [Romeriopsis navalis]MBE9029622.1 hypothetical protein [Romeriopsis navalis LEGE 11480]
MSDRKISTSKPTKLIGFDFKLSLRLMFDGEVPLAVNGWFVLLEKIKCVGLPAIGANLDRNARIN